MKMCIQAVLDDTGALRHMNKNNSKRPVCITRTSSPLPTFFCLAKWWYLSCGLLRVEEKGGRTMEMATDEPTPTASQQELSGSNTGHLTATYDSEDASYCALVDELVRGVESMPFVSKLNQLGGARPGFQASLTCYSARGFNSCGCKQSNTCPILVNRREPRAVYFET